MSEAQQRALDLEELAAYIDGRLDGDSKARMTARLADDPEAYELFVESLRAIDEEAKVGAGDAEVVAHPSARKPTWLIGSLAAVLGVLAIGVGLLLYQPWLGPTTRLVRMLAPERLATLPAIEYWYEPPLRAMRGGDPQRLRDAAAAVRLATRFVDLEAAAVAKDLTAFEIVKTRAITDANNADQLSLPLFIDSLQPITLELDELDRQLSAAFGDDPLITKRARLARWVETGRLALLAGDTSALRSRAYRRGAVSLASDDPARQAAAEEVEKIKGLLARPEAEREALTAAFERLVRLLEDHTTSGSSPGV